MAEGPHCFLITELQLLKVPFLFSVSLRAETGNLSYLPPSPPQLPRSCFLQQQKSMKLTQKGEGEGQIVTPRKAKVRGEAQNGLMK